MIRTLLVLALVAVVFLIFRSMWRSWRRRVVKGEVIPNLPTPPASRLPALADVAHATYLGTVTDEHWLDRVAAQGLGGRGPASITVLSTGLIVDRVGATTLFIPVGAVAEVALAKGIAGRVYGRDSVIVVSWKWGSTLMHTGLRVADPDSRRSVVEVLTQCVDGSDLSSERPESGGAMPTGE